MKHSFLLGIFFIAGFLFSMNDESRKRLCEGAQKKLCGLIVAANNETPILIGPDSASADHGRAVTESLFAVLHGVVEERSSDGPVGAFGQPQKLRILPSDELAHLAQTIQAYQNGNTLKPSQQMPSFTQVWLPRLFFFSTGVAVALSLVKFNSN